MVYFKEFTCLSLNVLKKFFADKSMLGKINLLFFNTAFYFKDLSVFTFREREREGEGEGEKHSCGRDT